MLHCKWIGKSKSGRKVGASGLMEKSMQRSFRNVSRYFSDASRQQCLLNWLHGDISWFLDETIIARPIDGTDYLRTKIGNTKQNIYENKIKTRHSSKWMFAMDSFSIDCEAMRMLEVWTNNQNTLKAIEEGNLSNKDWIESWAIQW